MSTFFYFDSLTNSSYCDPVKINDKQIQMELDTGAAVSLLSEGTYKQHWPEQ